MPHLFEVGKPTGFAGPDGVIFDLTDSGGILIIRAAKPTAEEKKAFKTGISFRYCIANGIIFVLVRMGRLPWMDAPYYRWLSKNLSRVILPSSGQGLAIHAMLIDGRNGVLVAQKLFSPDTKTSENFMAAAMVQPQIPNYDFVLAQTMARYTTDDLVELSRTQNNK